MRNSQINSQRGIDQIQVIQILLGGGLFPIKITCFDSCRMTYFLSLSLPGINGQGSKSRLCTPRIARRTISGTETELFVPIKYFTKVLVGLIFHKGSMDRTSSVRLHRSMIVFTCIRYIRTGKN